VAWQTAKGQSRVRLFHIATEPRPSCKNTKGDRVFDPSMGRTSSGEWEMIIGCIKNGKAQKYRYKR
jgi:hypothetical protein